MLSNFRNSPLFLKINSFHNFSIENDIHTKYIQKESSERTFVNKNHAISQCLVNEPRVVQGLSNPGLISHFNLFLFYLGRNIIPSFIKLLFCSFNPTNLGTNKTKTRKQLALLVAQVWEIVVKIFCFSPEL